MLEKLSVTGSATHKAGDQVDKLLLILQVTFSIQKQ